MRQQEPLRRLGLAVGATGILALATVVPAMASNTSDAPAPVAPASDVSLDDLVGTYPIVALMGEVEDDVDELVSDHNDNDVEQANDDQSADDQGTAEESAPAPEAKPAEHHKHHSSNIASDSQKSSEDDNDSEDQGEVEDDNDNDESADSNDDSGSEHDSGGDSSSDD